VRFLHGPRARRHHLGRRRLWRRGGLAAVVAVLGPGLLAGLSDDDPAGITTYSILGADHGYRLLWALTASTALLILFHELAARMGVVTGRGFLSVVRDERGPRAAYGLLGPLLVANVGTLCAEFAGVAAAGDLRTQLRQRRSLADTLCPPPSNAGFEPRDASPPAAASRPSPPRLRRYREE
jgi:Natural resistance-associated macrophage protein